MQSYSHEIDKHNIPEGSQLPINLADYLYLAVNVHFWQLEHEKVSTFVQPYLHES